MMNNEQVALVTDILDFMVHDGYGLRLNVFLKGCPLQCKWCQNPEAIGSDIEIAYNAKRCIGCGKCLEICPVPGAIVEDNRTRIDRTKCTLCLQCVEACPGTALQRVGEEYSVDALYEKINRYKVFFESSDRGGVTLSGGEPAYQKDFVLALLRKCREAGIHATIDTCGYAPYETLKEIAENVDLILYDIKHMDDAKHIEGTGVSNKLILDNLTRLCEPCDLDIVVRIPLITGYNDDEENVRKTAEFLKNTCNLDRLDLLPFNELPVDKYEAMGLKWDCSELKTQAREDLLALKKIVEGFGIRVTVGGMW
jgi:pyruvate formate lyase activating enzyme